MNILIVNCCIRGEKSRTWKLFEAFWDAFRSGPNWNEELCVERIDLMDLDLNCLAGTFFEEREVLLQQGKREHPRFRYAHQFAEADKIIVAAPFWDLSIPALLKIYIENISVDGITFGCDKSGMYGLCRASKLLFFTTRGNTVGDGGQEQGARYLKALCTMFGIPEFRCFCAEGLDLDQEKTPQIMSQAMKTAASAAIDFKKCQNPPPKVSEGDFYMEPAFVNKVNSNSFTGPVLFLIDSTVNFSEFSFNKKGTFYFILISVLPPGQNCNFTPG